jgi:hypothetical protein
VSAIGCGGCGFGQKRYCGWPAERTLAALGVPRSAYYGWWQRECLQDRPGRLCRIYEVLPE